MRNMTHDKDLRACDLIPKSATGRGLSRQKIFVTMRKSLLQQGLFGLMLRQKRWVAIGHEVVVVTGFPVATHGLGLRAHDRACGQA